MICIFSITIDANIDSEFFRTKVLSVTDRLLQLIITLIITLQLIITLIAHKYIEKHHECANMLFYLKKLSYI